MPEIINPRDDHREVHTSGGNVQEVTLVDQTGAAVSLSGGGGSGGAVTVADGADVAQGTTTDAAWDGSAAGPTLVGLLKALYTRLRGGQATMANSLPVVVASNQSAVPVSGTFWQATQPVSGTFWQATQPVSGTVTANAGTGTGTVQSVAASSATHSAVAASVTTVALLASNAARLGASIYNDNTGGASLYVAFAATATTSAFLVKLAPGAYWEMPSQPRYTGAISGIWDIASGSARMTEL